MEPHPPAPLGGGRHQPPQSAQRAPPPAPLSRPGGAQRARSPAPPKAKEREKAKRTGKAKRKGRGGEVGAGYGGGEPQSEKKGKSQKNGKSQKTRPRPPKRGDGGGRRGGCTRKEPKRARKGAHGSSTNLAYTTDAARTVQICLEI